jgi:hypothetical protein
MWEVEYTDQFETWWSSLNLPEQESVATVVSLLQDFGPHLPYPYCSAIQASRYGHMRELRIQHRGRPLRILYAFDPRRVAILLIGGNKTGKEGWYETFVPIADKIYDQHLAELRKEGLIRGKEV